MSESVTEEQIRTIYRDTIDALYGYVSRRCGGERALAEDVTQETWLRAVPQWRERGPPDQPLAWLTTVARNLLLNQLRRRPSVSLDANEIIAAVDGNRAAESAHAAHVVTAALARLSRRDARLLEAFHLDGLRVAQIAVSLGVSERAIEGRLRRARVRLRRQLEVMSVTREGTV